jgi:hypothetical protein
MICFGMHMKPKRIQLSRRRGWRMPSDTAKIDRSTKWGNPFKVGRDAVHPESGITVSVGSKETAIALFALYLRTAGGAEIVDAARRELRGKDLACWCHSGDACHGDILLTVANARHVRRRERSEQPTLLANRLGNVVEAGDHPVPESAVRSKDRVDRPIRV